MASGTLIVNIRLSADFVLTVKEDSQISSKYVQILDKDGKCITEGELYRIGYELEDGTDCDEDGTPII